MIKHETKDKMISCFKWPGNSPDLNPTENIFAVIKARLIIYYTINNNL